MVVNKPAGLAVFFFFVQGGSGITRNVRRHAEGMRDAKARSRGWCPGWTGKPQVPVIAKNAFPPPRGPAHSATAGAENYWALVAGCRARRAISTYSGQEETRTPPSCGSPNMARGARPRRDYYAVVRDLGAKTRLVSLKPVRAHPSMRAQMAHIVCPSSAIPTISTRKIGTLPGGLQKQPAYIGATDRDPASARRRESTPPRHADEQAEKSWNLLALEDADRFDPIEKRAGGRTAAATINFPGAQQRSNQRCDLVGYGSVLFGMAAAWPSTQTDRVCYDTAITPRRGFSFALAVSACAGISASGKPFAIWVAALCVAGKPRQLDEAGGFVVDQRHHHRRRQPQDVQIPRMRLLLSS